MTTVARLSAAFGRLLDALAVLAALILLAMVVIVTADIVLRNLTRGGFIWANEVSEYALYLMTLLTAPVAVAARPAHPARSRARDAAGAGGLAHRGGQRRRRASACASCWCATAFVMAYDSCRIGAITIKNLVFPEWWLLAPLPVAFALLAIEFVFRLAPPDGRAHAPRRKRPR